METSQSIGMLLHDVARLLQEQAARSARPRALTDGQWQALRAIAKHEGIHQSALAEMVRMEPVSLGRIIERMEDKDLVERRDHETDRRKRLVYLKPKSQSLLDRIDDRGRVIGEDLLSRFSASDRQLLHRALSLIKTNLLGPDEEGRAHEARHD